MNCTSHHFACDCREALFAALKAELEDMKARLDMQAEGVFLAEHDENVRLHSELEAAKTSLAKAKAALEEILRFCHGGDPCGATENVRCRIFEHRIARDILEEL